MRRPVAVVASAAFVTAQESRRNDVEMLLPVIAQALAEAGLSQRDIGFTVSGSSDYLAGFPFAFVGALDAVGAWPPIRESHLEMDGAFALAEAVAVLAHGELDTALVYAFARPSRGELDRTLALQLDPYLVAPLWPDARGLAGLQAQAMRDSGRFGDIAAVPPTEVCDGAVAVVLAVGERAGELTARPAWIRGVEHRIEAPALGVRDLTAASSVRQAAAALGLAGGTVEAAWLHAPYPHQELLLRDALGLSAAVPVDAVRGPVMVAGLERIAAAARAVSAGTVTRAVAHATSGPCLQQNLLALLEAGPA